jgi:hypothetical protein
VSTVVNLDVPRTVDYSLLKGQDVCVYLSSENIIPSQKMHTENMEKILDSRISIIFHFNSLQRQ